MAEADPNARLLALSDGVVAVAITLLVLDIRLPNGFGAFNDQQLLDALITLWPRIFSYLLSFLVITSFWLSHRAKFNHMVKTDGWLMWINAVFLLTVGLVPFTTNLIADNGGTVATTVYAGTMVISGLSLAWLWTHAYWKKLLDPAVTKVQYQHQLQRTLLVAGIFAVSVPLSVTHSGFAKFVWLLIIPVNFGFRWIALQRWKREHPGQAYPADPDWQREQKEAKEESE